MPGPTETEFFERAELMDTKVGQEEKADPAKVAVDGYAAMKKGEAGVVSGFMNKVQALFSGIIPDTVLAQMHRSDEHTSELQSLMRISYAVFCLKNKTYHNNNIHQQQKDHNAI